MGPDPGVRLNLRIGRFIKSYLRFLPWHDDRYYLQTQAYWIFNNLTIYNRTKDRKYLDHALRCADIIASRQKPEGYWDYPGGEWKQMIATVEICFGGLGLIAAFDAGQDERYLEHCRSAYNYLIENTGFQRYGEDSAAINYFSNCPRGLVTNNSTVALWFFSKLSKATGDSYYLDHCGPMAKFVTRVQLDTGELPYSLGNEEIEERIHYLCFQYNAFQFMDLAEYYELSCDQTILHVLDKLAVFLSGGLLPSGDGRHCCHENQPIVNYYTGAISAALMRANSMGLGDYSSLVKQGFERLCALQHDDGSFDHSWNDYGFLRDRRTYPRYQLMILKHLLDAEELSNRIGGGCD